MNNYQVNSRKMISHSADENTNEVFSRLKKIQGLATVMAQIAAGEFINLESLRQKLMKDEDYQKSALDEKVRRFEIELIVEALVKSGGRQNMAARLLGLKHTTLNAKIKRYQIPIGKIATAQLEDFIAGGK